MRALVLCSLLACGEPASTKTTYFAEDADRVVARLSKLTARSFQTAHDESDVSASPEIAGQRRVRGLLFGEGPFDMVLVGTIGVYRVCRIQVGPAPVRRPLDPRFMFELLDDPRLATRLRDAVGPLPVERYYSTRIDVEGIRVAFEQFEVGGRPNVMFVLDGCNRVTPRQGDRRDVNEHELPVFEPGPPRR